MVSNKVLRKNKKKNSDKDKVPILKKKWDCQILAIPTFIGHSRLDMASASGTIL